MSSTESKYSGLSYSLRDAIPMMQLLEEFKSNGIQHTPTSKAPVKKTKKHKPSKQFEEELKNMEALSLSDDSDNKNKSNDEIT